MAIGYVKTLNGLNTDTDSTMTSKFVVTATPELWFAYENDDTHPDDVVDNLDHSRIYFRKYTISNGNLSAAVDISGASGDINGWGSPDLVRITSTGRLICGYEKGKFQNAGLGFVIKESSDNGATWGSSYTGGGSFPNHHFRGLFYDTVTGGVIAITQAIKEAGATITVHKRTGAGTWTSATAFSGSTSNYFSIVNWPQQNVVYYNGTIVIVGSRATSTSGMLGISSLRSTNATSWTEVPIVTYSVAARRVCLLARSPDGSLRLIHAQPGTGGNTAPPVVGYSNDLGLSWTMMGTPQAFSTNDTFGLPVTFPPPDYDLMGLAIDDRGTQFLTVTDRATDRMHVFRAFNPGALKDWQLLQSATISNAGVTYDQSFLSPQPHASVVVSTNFFRVLSVWDEVTAPSKPYTQLWLLKLAAAGQLPGGKSGGGGGTPRTYSDV